MAQILLIILSSLLLVASGVYIGYQLSAPIDKLIHKKSAPVAQPIEPIPEQQEVFSGPRNQNFETSLGYYSEFTIHAKLTFLFRLTKALSFVEAKKLKAYLALNHNL
jgi:hypothetical protein